MLKDKYVVYVVLVVVFFVFSACEMEGKHTSSIPACFSFLLSNRQLRLWYMKVGS